jgi:hypothetical protein
MPPRPIEPIYNELERYAGEYLEITSIRVILLTSHVVATVRYDGTTTFEIPVYKPAQQLLVDAGYTIPDTRGEHPFTATVVCEWAKHQYEKAWQLRIIHVDPQASEPVITPLARQSAIETLLRTDSHLQKLVTGVWASYDIYGKPLLTIECKRVNYEVLQAVVMPLAGDMPITWHLVEAKRFTGSFDITERIPTLDTIDSTHAATAA